MPFTELPADLKLEILKYLDSWEDKNSFAKIDKSTWDTCLNTYDSKVYRINQKSINILRLSTSKSIELPEANISNKLLKLLLECAYKATHIKLPREETCQNAKKKVLSYTSLHMKQSPITILAFEEEEREWLTLTKTLLYTRLQSPPSIVYYDENGNRCNSQQDINCVNNSTSQQEVSNMELNDISGLPFTPSPVVDFTNRRVKYHLDQSEAVDVDLLAPTHIHTLDTANTIAIQMGTKFIESVIYIDRYWFYVTSLGVFNLRAKDIDDCANNTAYDFYDKVTARITKKTTGSGSEYFELMIAIGHIECVATGGFFGVVNRNGWRSFLGPMLLSLTSDIKNHANKVTNQVYVTSTPVRVWSTPRLLNQYANMDSGQDWAFHSYSFANMAFYPVHPFRFGDHLSGVTNKADQIFKLASIILNCTANNYVTKNDVERALQIATQNEKLADFFTDQTIGFHTIKESPEFAHLDEYTKKVISLLAIFENYVKNTDRYNLMMFKIAEKDSILYLMKNKMNDELKKVNKKIRVKFQNNYVI